MPYLRTVLPACGLALVAASSVAAQTAAADSPRPSIFLESVDVGLVNVTAVVTDGRGNPVLGLTREDFELLEDGEAVEITNFHAQDPAEHLASQLARGEALAAGARPDPPDVDVIQERRLNLVVYVDNFNMRPENRRRVLPQVLDFLQTRLARGDAVMVASYGPGLAIDQHFTRELALVEHALRGMDETVSARTADDLHRRQVLQHMRRAAEEGRQRDAYQYVRGYVQESSTELRRSMKALASVVRSLGGLPGRKAILYLSDGLPKRPGEDLYQVLADYFAVAGLELPGEPEQPTIDPSLEMLQEDQSKLFTGVIREANAGQVTFYTIDARGGKGESSLSADNPALAADSSGGIALDQLRTQTFQEPLIDLAVATGGSAVLNAFMVRERLHDVAADLDSAYSLAFRSRHGGDGKYHRIEVRVRRPGLVVRHRAGYFDKPEAVRIADRTFSSLLLGLGKNPLGVEVEVGKAERKGLRRYHLPLLVRVPLARVTLLPNGASHEGRLRFFLVVRDEDGGISDVHEFEYPVVVPAAELDRARGRELALLRTLEVRPGVPQVAAGVWDELSGADSYVLIKARVGGRSSSGAGG